MHICAICNSSLEQSELPSEVRSPAYPSIYNVLLEEKKYRADAYQ